MGDDGRRPRCADSKSLPDSFCRFSTLERKGQLPDVPASLRGLHLTARLKVGDLLYLPASWFHEVISRGAGAGGHMALNLWMAPPSTGASFERPYIDSFWGDHYQSLRPATCSAGNAACIGKRKARRKGKKKVTSLKVVGDE